MLLPRARGNRLQPRSDAEELQRHRIPVRRLRPAALFIVDQIPQRHGLAQASTSRWLNAVAEEARRLGRHGPDRVPLPPVRRPQPRLQRQAHGPNSDSRCAMDGLALEFTCPPSRA